MNVGRNLHLVHHAREDDVSGVQPFPRASLVTENLLLYCRQYVHGSSTLVDVECTIEEFWVYSFRRGWPTALLIVHPLVGELPRSFALGAMPKTKYGVRDYVHFHMMHVWKGGVEGTHDIPPIFSVEHLVCMVFCVRVPSAVRGSMLPEGVQDALNVRELEFHRCLDGDRLLQSEDRVGGRCCEAFHTLSQLLGLCDVLSFLASYLGMLGTQKRSRFNSSCSVERNGFSQVLTGNSVWGLFRLFVPWADFKNRPWSCRRSTRPGLGLKILQNDKILRCCLWHLKLVVDECPAIVNTVGARATSFYDHADDRLVVLENVKTWLEMCCLECWMDMEKPITRHVIVRMKICEWRWLRWSWRLSVSLECGNVCKTQTPQLQCRWTFHAQHLRLAKLLLTWHCCETLR